MNQFELVAEAREEVGKGAIRRLRRKGKLPGIIYGADKEVSMIMLDHDNIMHHLDHEAFYSHILILKIGNKSEKVVLKDLQRHSYKKSVLHIDLQRINEKEALTMRIPLHFINEDQCIGVKQGGGVISRLLTEIDIVCLPKDLPEYIEVDLIEVNLNETLHLSDLTFPEGVQAYSLLHGGDDSLPVVSVHTPKVSGSDTDDAEDASESAEVAVDDADEKEVEG